MQMNSPLLYASRGMEFHFSSRQINITEVKEYLKLGTQAARQSPGVIWLFENSCHQAAPSSLFYREKADVCPAAET